MTAVVDAFRDISTRHRPPVPSRPVQPRVPFDDLIVGAGFSGAVLAERLARVDGRRVLVVDRRNHVAGNAHDTHDRAGVMIHPHGPHVFHTNSDQVFGYVSRFTRWRPYAHRVMAEAEDRLVPVAEAATDPRCSDRHVAMPLHGYTAMIEHMLDHPNITLALHSTYDDARRVAQGARVFWSGRIDEYFGYRYGPLPYRSLRFRHVTLELSHFQPAAEVLGPEGSHYTRVFEHRQFTGQSHRATSLTFEYPSDRGEPYYTVPTPQTRALYHRYAGLAAHHPEVVFFGRLGTYRDQSLGQVVARSLALHRSLSPATRRRERATYRAGQIMA